MSVSIYADNGSYKIFDSYAQDEYSRSHSSGTCVLLEVPSIQSFVQYFQTIHSLTDTGVQISTYEIIYLYDYSFILFFSHAHILACSYHPLGHSLTKKKWGALHTFWGLKKARSSSS